MKNRVTESEYELMKILWESSELMTVNDVCGALMDKQWKKTTVATLLTRLEEKGIIGFRQKGRAREYYPILKREEYNLSETKSLLSRIYNGSVKNLVAELYESSEVAKEDIY